MKNNVSGNEFVILKSCVLLARGNPAQIFEETLLFNLDQRNGVNSADNREETRSIKKRSFFNSFVPLEAQEMKEDSSGNKFSQKFIRQLKEKVR